MPSQDLPQITVEDLAARLKSSDPFVLLDVREPWEVERAAIPDERVHVSPLSGLTKTGIGGLPPAAQSPEAEIYVLCHQGVRSADVTRWLVSRGWTRTFTVVGGIDAYANRIDDSVGSY
jgi:rhodanese-related sulfurtransferase